jgi:hypothetical protein
LFDGGIALIITALPSLSAAGDESFISWQCWVWLCTHNDSSLLLSVTTEELKKAESKNEK